MKWCLLDEPQLRPINSNVGAHSEIIIWIILNYNHSWIRSCVSWLKIKNLPILCSYFNPTAEGTRCRLHYIDCQYHIVWSLTSDNHKSTWIWLKHWLSEGFYVWENNNFSDEWHKTVIRECALKWQLCLGFRDVCERRRTKLRNWLDWNKPNQDRRLIDRLIWSEFTI